MSAVTLAINNCFAAKRWPEPAEWTRIVADELALRHVQFSFDLLDPGLPEPVRSEACAEVRRACADRGLSVGSTFTGLVAYARSMLADPDPSMRAQAAKWYESAINISERLGAKATGGFFGSLSAADMASPARKQKMRQVLIESVRGLATMAHEHGQQVLLWELMPHPREMPHSPAEAVDMLAEANEGSPIPIRLCFDLGHCCAPDLVSQEPDPYEWLQRLLPWTHMVHLQQTDGKADRHWPFTREFNQRGCISPERIVQMVKASPLANVEMILEVCHGWEADEQQILRDLKESVEAFARWV